MCGCGLIVMHREVSLVICDGSCRAGRLRSLSQVVAGATLAVAALSQPARRRIQQVVDRRFNRRKYNTAKTMEVFRHRLRDEIHLAALTAELPAVVDQMIQPTRSLLWLRPSASDSPRTAP
jgi:hypothetical protein